MGLSPVKSRVVIMIYISASECTNSEWKNMHQSWK